MTFSPKIKWLSALLVLSVSVVLSSCVEVKPPAQKFSFGGQRTEIVVAGCPAFIIEPDAPAKDGSKPWIWYAPVVDRNPGPALTWLMSQLLQHGFYVCGIDVGDNYAKPAARAQFEAFYQQMRATYGLDPKASLLAQSRGGLNLYHFASAHPDQVACIAGIYPVGDLRSYPGLARAAKAYGLTEAQLAGELPSHNPIDLLAPIAKAKIPILHVHGDADKIVPIEKNSGAIAERYRAHGGPMRLIVIPKHGHEEIPAYFESPELLRFLLSQGRSLATP